MVCSVHSAKTPLWRLFHNSLSVSSDRDRLSLLAIFLKKSHKELSSSSTCPTEDSPGLLSLHLEDAWPPGEGQSLTHRSGFSLQSWDNNRSKQTRTRVHLRKPLPPQVVASEKRDSVSHTCHLTWFILVFLISLK